MIHPERHPMDDVAYVIYRSYLKKDFVLSGRGAGRGGHLAGTGVGGFGHLAAEVLTQGTAQGVERFTGFVVKKREIETKIQVSSDTPAGFYIRNAEWWKHQSITEQGFLVVSTLLDGPRIARVRLSPDESVGEAEQVKDASFLCARDYNNFAWMAEDPYVRGLQERWRWQNTTLGGAGKLILNNPGDFVANVELVGTGPGRWKIQGDDGVLITFPQIVANDAIRVDTDRLRPAVTNATGINLWAQMGGQRLRLSLQPRTQKTIRVELLGGNASSAIVSVIRPRYARLW
jgi:hypothetical protein